MEQLIQQSQLTSPIFTRDYTAGINEEEVTYSFEYTISTKACRVTIKQENRMVINSICTNAKMLSGYYNIEPNDPIDELKSIVFTDLSEIFKESTTEEVEEV